MKIRAIQDNVVVQFLPRPQQSKGGILLPASMKPVRTGVREAEVLAAGPGYYRDNGFGSFIPTTVKVGEIVLVDELCGQDFAADNYKPRQNKNAEYGEIRVVREDEIHAVVERG